jgi:hypothetical protein
MNLNYEEIMKAFIYADHAHSGRLRTGTGIPAIQHPRQVGILCLMHTCDQELCIAGFLHEAVDSTAVTLEEIRERFGDRIADIVAACSEHDLPVPWQERKNHIIESLRHTSRDIKVVACANELHNLLTMLEQHELEGDKLWERLDRGRDEQEQFYRELVKSIGSDGFEQEELHWFLEAAVECLFGSGSPEKGAFLLRHLQWLRGPNRISMIYFTDTFQHNIGNLAMFGERINVNISSPIKMHISFDPELYEASMITVGFIDDDEHSLMRIEIDDRMCKFIERYYIDLLDLVHFHTCTNLNYFVGVIEELNLLELEPGHYLMGPTEDGLSMTTTRIDDRSKGEHPISLVFDDYGEHKPASELSKGVAKFFFNNLLKNEEVAECFVGVRSEAGGLFITQDMPLAPPPSPEQIADQSQIPQADQEPA